MTRLRTYGMFCLFALLLAVYTMTNAGYTHVVDEDSLYSVTESLALRGRADTNVIAWTQWVNSPGEVLGAFGPEGDVYSKKGPAPAFLAAPWYLMLRTAGLLGFNLGVLQGALLWNGVVTALTAALLWAAALRLGYNDRTGAALGLLFGLSTIAWPFANQFFGEPLSALSLLACFYGALSWRRTNRPLWMLVAGLGGALAVATVTAHAVLVALLAAYAFAAWWADARTGNGADRENSGGRRNIVALLPALLYLMAPIAVAGGLLLAYNAARFGSPFDTGYHFDSGEGFTTPLWRGLWGLLFSPYRSVFLHTPLFIASLIATPAFWRRHRWESYAIAALSTALLLLYSLWWMWWGGYAWGPRFLVPLTPFWTLLLAPLVACTLDALSGGDLRGRLRRIGPTGGALVGLAALSFLVQLSAVAVNFANWETELRGHFPTNWDNPLEFGPPAQSLADLFYSPVFGQWRLIFADFAANSDLAWLWPDGNIQWLVLLIGGAGILTLALAFAHWWWVQGDPARPLPGRIARLLLPLLPLLVISVWTGEVSRHPKYGSPDAGYRPALADLCREAETGDAVVTVAPYSYHISQNWLPILCDRPMPVVGYAVNSAEQEEGQSVLERLNSSKERIWLVTSGLPVSDPENSVERWLARNSYKADDRWYEDYRLVRYATARPLADRELLPIGVPLTDNAGTQVTMAGVRLPGTIRPGQAAPVDVYYRIDFRETPTLRWFVQLLSPDGFPIALVDVGFEDEYVSFDALPLGDTLIDHFGLQLPSNIAPGSYQLIAGLYNPNDEGARLISPAGADFVELGFITVE